MADLHLLLDGRRLKAQAIRKRQALQRVLQAAGLRTAGLPLVVAAPADAMHALGDVDHLEVGAEGPHHGLGLLRRAPGQAIGQQRQRGRLHQRLEVRLLLGLVLHALWPLAGQLLVNVGRVQAVAG